MKNSVCFTGHRPEKIISPYNEKSTIVQYIKSRLAEQVLIAIKDGYDTFYTGMAKGTDIYAAEIIIKLKSEYPNLKLICAIPYKQQSNGFSEFWSERYQRIISNADQVITLSDHYYNGCLHFRNNYMVNNSSRVIAVFNGNPSGTFSTITYAKRCNKELCIISI